jgi:thiamine-monophosphate kinase
MTSPTLADLGEWDWLAKVRSKLSGPSSPELIVPIGDDAAVWKPDPGPAWIATCDAHCEGTHFQKSWLEWAGLARRSVLAAASDITAMGGTPKGFLISLGAPGETPVRGLEAFTEEVSRLSHRYGLWPMGGDTFRSERIVVDVTVLGAALETGILRQTGAKPGDAIWVTGWLGTMRAAWTALHEDREGEEALRKGFWDPPARWPLLQSLRETLAIRAMTDLSDGLAHDLRKILDREELGAEIELDRLPLDPAIREFFEDRGQSAPEAAYAGGEDFELLIVESGDSGGQGSALIEGVPLTRIGRVTEEMGRIRTALNGGEHEVTIRGFEHFS